MHGPVKGEFHSPGVGPVRMLRIRQVQEPHKGGFGRNVRFGVRGGRGESETDRYSEAPADSASNRQNP